MSGESDVLHKIVDSRRARISRTGHAQGEFVPDARDVPLVTFGRDPFVICEIKRKSPSRGDIGPGADPVMQAAKYVSRGIQSVSVLTEPEYFGGSLEDLRRVKQQYPQLSVLRKDFLLDEEDIEISYRAGADAVLLIASVLEPAQLERMHTRALELGMQALVELHTVEELEAVRPIAPPLVGVNSRDLKTFRMDPLVPLRLRELAGNDSNWSPRWVFESGVFEEEHAALAASSAFDAVLVGEAVMRSPDRITGIVRGLSYTGRHDFWPRIARRISENASDGNRDCGNCDYRPLIKICGLTWQEDARFADQQGADLLGFVFADSPRRAEASMLRSLGKTRALKVGVVVCGGDKQFPAEVQQLLQEGILDAVQFSGDELPADCFPMAFPYYKAIRPASVADCAEADNYHCPRVLVDARSPDGAYGGSGHRIPADIVESVKGPLWLAGGLNPENVRQAVRDFRPELVDVASGLESHPGKKDPRKIRAFIEEVQRGAAENIR
ncbi:phosphoribosylanthranilate isomerase [Spirochaeta dissipatitropha]